MKSILAHCGIIISCFTTVTAMADDSTHEEITPITFDIGESGKITTMAMDRSGNLLCGVSWLPAGAKTPESDEPQQRGRRRMSSSDDNLREFAIKVVSPAGKVTETWPMPIVKPKMIHGNADGSFYVGGMGMIGKFSANGKLLTSIKISDVLDGAYDGSHVSGVTANEKYFFVAFGHGFSMRATEDIVRFDSNLKSPKLLIETQYGCCSHIDLDTKDDVLLIAENSRHRVNQFSFEGDRKGTWGERNRTDISGFTACCNPVNFDFGPKGVLYTAESGVGRVKKYTADGKYLGLVGYVDTTKFDRGSRLAAQSCYIPVEVSKDGKRVYIMDVRAHVIRVLQEKKS